MQPYHKHKRTSFREEFKTLNDVFDLSTEETLWKLITQGLFSGLESPISIGKEANIFTARTSEGSLRIVKIYRLSTCDFGKMYTFIRTDPRLRDLHKNARSVVHAWCQREYRNLLKAREAGVRVPTPYGALKNVLVMEFIGSHEPAQRLRTKTPEQPALFLKEIIHNMKLLTLAGMVHGDLSPYNILNFNDKPVLIDFSQATVKQDPNFATYLTRDVKNITDYFRKLGVKTTENIVLKQVR